MYKYTHRLRAYHVHISNKYGRIGTNVLFFEEGFVVVYMYLKQTFKKKKKNIMDFLCWYASVTDMVI